MIKLIKIPGEQNPSDVLTKYVKSEVINKFLDRLGIEYRVNFYDLSNISKPINTIFIKYVLYRSLSSQTEGDRRSSLAQTMATNSVFPPCVEMEILDEDLKTFHEINEKVWNIADSIGLEYYDSNAGFKEMIDNEVNTQSWKKMSNDWLRMLDMMADMSRVKGFYFEAQRLNTKVRFSQLYPTSKIDAAFERMGRKKIMDYIAAESMIKLDWLKGKDR